VYLLYIAYVYFEYRGSIIIIIAYYMIKMECNFDCFLEAI